MVHPNPKIDTVRVMIQWASPTLFISKTFKKLKRPLHHTRPTLLEPRNVSNKGRKFIEESIGLRRSLVSLTEYEDGERRSGFWLGDVEQIALRSVVLVSAAVYCLLFPALLAFEGPFQFADRPIFFTFCVMLDVLLWVDMACRFFTPGLPAPFTP